MNRRTSATERWNVLRAPSAMVKPGIHKSSLGFRTRRDLSEYAAKPKGNWMRRLLRFFFHV